MSHVSFKRDCPNPSCPLCVVVVAPTRAVGLRAVGSGPIHGQLPLRQETPLWVPPLCGLVVGTAPTAWPPASVAPCEQVAGGCYPLWARCGSSSLLATLAACARPYRGLAVADRPLSSLPSL
ncbi:hypothetical protein BHE74_00015824 [Ensete ventricosum]|nr:hypothetical protein GW17_00026578 [Ensete ventricosum]RWW76113.1 hypothetical protein BHE74_00015824 [Ensete ventricosum]RZR95579.1 hypothetical protein BHM03_00024439 [Ensete ventricosum]